MYIDQNNTKDFISNYVEVLKNYENVNDVYKDNNLSEDVSRKILNKNLDCNIISQILQNNDNINQFKKEINDVVITNIMISYLEKFGIKDEFNKFFNTIKEQSKGGFNIMKDPEQLEMLVQIMSGNLLTVPKHPIVYMKLMYNLNMINDSNMTMKKMLYSGDLMNKLKDKLANNNKDIIKIFNESFSKGSQLDINNSVEFIKKINEIVNNKLNNISPNTKNLFSLLISNKTHFKEVFSVIISKLKVKMQNECKNINNEQIKDLEKILLEQVDDYNKNRTLYIMKAIKQVAKDKFVTDTKDFFNYVTDNTISSTVSNGISSVINTLNKTVDNCKENPDKCKQNIDNIKENAKNASNQAQKFMKNIKTISSVM